MSRMDPLWMNTLSVIEKKLDTHQFNHWFKPIVCESITDGEVVLRVPDKFFQDWLQDNYLELLRSELQQQSATDINVRFKYEDASQQPKNAEKSDETVRRSIPLDRRYNFDRFVVGPSNQFVHAACMAVTEAPGRNYNPLFIYGGVGLGKTHLMQAIGNELRRRNSDIRIRYINSETYINELITSIRTDQMDKFRSRYRRECDVLLIDDIQFIAGKDRTQIEFFHTFNSLYGDHKQIVITSDRFPQEIQGLEERLKSRFQWGLIADIQPPELETRIAILNRKASYDGVQLPEDVAMFLAQHVKNNVRELEGMLIRLTAHCRITGCPIDIDATRHILKDVLQSSGIRVSIQQIQKLVASHFNVSVSDLKGGRRHRAIALPRMIAMYLIRQNAGSSYPEIGRRFGNRDHSTVISAVKKIEGQLTTNNDVRKIVQDLQRSLV
jgi:chromosomal replication initiator protein